MSEPPAGRADRDADWSLPGRLRVLFAAVAAVLVAVTVVGLIATYEFVSSSNTVIYRWQRAGIYGLRLLDDLVNQETGVRGYELTRDPVSLAPYRSSVTAQRRDVRLLRDRIAGDAELKGQLAAVERAADEWTRTVATPAIDDVRAGRSSDEATQLAAKASFDRIRARLTRLTGTLQHRSEATRSARTTEGRVTMGLVAFALLLVVGSGVVLRRGLDRWVLRPMNRLAAQTRVVRSGETHRTIVGDGPIELVELGSDVEAMRLQIAGQLDEAERVHAELLQRGEELARSNDDLQQFAYVASHDLSEPLRKVANFCQLLERQYADQLDDRARQYIHFAVDGAKRMQALITDLLALSRVGRSTERFEVIDLNEKLDRAMANLADRIDEAGASVERLTPLPRIDGDRALLVSLLENLLGNAVKYRRDGVAPVIRVSAELDDDTDMWTFTVADNGIGIDPQYAERIFAVFQRLHLRDSYGGTGIGLALCRRIVEFHGGRIWLADVESPPGATFRFTLPKGENRAEPRHRDAARAAGVPACGGRPG